MLATDRNITLNKSHEEQPENKINENHTNNMST